MIRRVWRRWRDRNRIVAECECGAQLTRRARHLLVSHSADDEVLGIDGGGTLMAASFCGEHCPGGCKRGCPTL